jgi:hypothetical protein
MHEDERWIPAARFLVAKSHSVTNQPRHARQSARAPDRTRPDEDRDQFELTAITGMGRSVLRW